jgi:hypothetical protein
MRRAAIALLMAMVVAVGLRWGTFAVGGSDSYCYVAQAQAWASGRLQTPEPLATAVPWPNGPTTFAPAGHIPSPTVPGAVAPICPSGLSAVMAPFVVADRALGASPPRGDGRLVFAVVPLCGALLVWAVYLMGARYATGVGLAAAALMACSPIFLFQLVQPMSDVPATAMWALALAAATSAHGRGPVLAGLCTSLAVAIRPNLLPLGVVVGVFLLVRPGRATPTRWRDGVTYALASMPGCLFVAGVQTTFFGSPLRSGYGSLADLFAWSHVSDNARRYATWMTAAHSWAWGLAVVGVAGAPTAVSALFVGVIIVTVALYLPYTVFNDWWYLRFLLPAVACVIVLGCAGVHALASRWVKGAGRPTGVGLMARVVATVVVCGLGWQWVGEARRRSAFDLWRLESRYVRAGHYVAAHLPPNAFVFASWESGSVRYYGHRLTLVWDGLDEGWLDRAVTFAVDRGFEPFFLFERWEEPGFRARFGGTGLAALDWPPTAEVGGQVRIYRPSDRDRYLGGGRVSTDYAR